MSERLDWHGWTVALIGQRALVGPVLPLDPTRSQQIFDNDGSLLFEAFPNPSSVISLAVKP